MVRSGSDGRRSKTKGNRDHLEFTHAELNAKRGKRKGTMESYFGKK